jgi:Protein of unknown function (DUF732)
MKKILAAGMAAAALAFAPTAHADPSTDSAFIMTLQMLDIDYYAHSSEIHAAHSVCRAYDNGYGDTDVIASIAAANVEMTHSEAAQFVGAATAAYCPQYSGYVPGTIA